MDKRNGIITCRYVCEGHMLRLDGRHLQLMRLGIIRTIREMLGVFGHANQDVALGTSQTMKIHINRRGWRCAHQQWRAEAD